MKKNNVTVTAKKQRKQIASKARRKRRVSKRMELVLAKVRPLILKLGQLQQQIETLTKEKQREQAGIKPEEAAK